MVDSVVPEPNTPSANVPLLEAKGITKEFPGVIALDDVQFELRGGEVHALVGENGAGKSTLIKVIAGIHQPNKGTVKINGEAVHFDGPLDAQKHGVSVIHQELNLMPDLTVAQNIFFGREPIKGGQIDDRKMNQETQKLLDRLKIGISPRIKVAKLTVASQQMVEIAKALSLNAKILIMDEPTAALTDSEVETLFSVIDDFISPDTAIIYVSHRMNEIKRISDRITVFRDGKYVSTGDAADLEISDIIAQMVGREIDTDIRPAAKVLSDDDIVLEVKDMCSKTLLRNVSFKLRKGEILGFAGLMGAGRTETARCLVGADPITSGTITIDGQTRKVRSPADAVDAGIGYLSEDRKRYGLLLDNPITKNVGLASYKLWSNFTGWIFDKQTADITEEYRKKLSIKTPSVWQLAKNLSGGNQQKVVLAKWLARDCDILIFDEPTRGIDVGAKDEIYNLIDELVAAGKSLIVISSEIPEVLRVSDRICVMCDGRITGVLENEEATQENIMELATQFHSLVAEEA
ncbi:MAG: sugar ABC transporter ATP-binding protein [Actinomycetaceae bacterium]|nr:sugar ABC transporter ATP-binding protein [Actinomycetaceae bacterium]